MDKIDKDILTILQENDIILNESIFIDIDRVEPPKQFHFELFSENGDVNNIKVIDSQCVQFDENEEIYFKKCPFFKNVSMGAAMYFKYTPPKDTNGNACLIKDKLHKYNFQRMRSFHEYIDSYDGPESIDTKK